MSWHRLRSSVVNAAGHHQQQQGRLRRRQRQQRRRLLELVTTGHQFNRQRSVSTRMNPTRTFFRSSSSSSSPSSPSSCSLSSRPRVISRRGWENHLERQRRRHRAESERGSHGENGVSGGKGGGGSAGGNADQTADGKRPWPLSMRILGYGLAGVGIPYGLAWFLSLNELPRRIVCDHLLPRTWNVEENVLRRWFGEKEWDAVPYVDRMRRAHHRDDHHAHDHAHDHAHAGTPIPLRLQDEPTRRERNIENEIRRLASLSVPVRVSVVRTFIDVDDDDEQQRQQQQQQRQHHDGNRHRIVTTRQVNLPGNVPTRTIADLVFGDDHENKRGSDRNKNTKNETARGLRNGESIALDFDDLPIPNQDENHKSMNAASDEGFHDATLMTEDDDDALDSSSSSFSSFSTTNSWRGGGGEGRDRGQNDGKKRHDNVGLLLNSVQYYSPWYYGPEWSPEGREQKRKAEAVSKSHQRTTPLDRDIAALDYQVKELRRQLNDPLTTRDLDDVQNELSIRRKELSRLQWKRRFGGWL